MKLIHQPFDGQLGNTLIDLLESQSYDTLNIAVAFAKSSGVLRLKKSFDTYRKFGGVINVYVGVDLCVTSYEALNALLFCTDTLSVVHSERGQTFHTKTYQFLGKEKGMVIVGSNNLTGGGLWTNFESSAYISLDMSNADDCEIHKSQDEYFKSLASLDDSFMPIKTRDDIDNLLCNGYISKEVTQKLRTTKTTEDGEKQKCLFGNGAPAARPRIKALPKDVDTALQPEEKLELLDTHSEIIWFETKRLTGGSRNILDLSKRSLVEKGDPKGTAFDLEEAGFMRGGVEFFGINPNDTDLQKNITLNFEGVDYINNTILFPTGNNANGTWRLQIKGVSTSGDRITDTFRAKGEEHYLVMKVITFTKIKDDYYSITVFPESELEKFKAASRILARNGSTRSAKQLGLF